jgi:8-oxo-dGTP pyrophosphatase MutT (NUDIX family)
MAKAPMRMRAYLLLSRFRRAMTLGVRGAVFDPAGRVFLIKHSYVAGWHMPGGGVEVGETFERAMARELMEEGGIALTGPAELFGLYLNMASGRDHVALYVCRQWEKARELKLPNLEIVDAGFFPPGALPDGTTEATRRRLSEILTGGPRPQEW